MTKRNNMVHICFLFFVDKVLLGLSPLRGPHGGAMGKEQTSHDVIEFRWMGISRRDRIYNCQICILVLLDFCISAFCIHHFPPEVLRSLSERAGIDVFMLLVCLQAFSFGFL